MSTEVLKDGIEKAMGDELNNGTISHSESVTPRLGAQTSSDSLSGIHDAHYYNDRIRSLESEKLSIMIEHNNLIKEFNKRMESHMEEIRGLKDSNMQFEIELKDLQELSVFLDDDRRKCRKLAKEWQRFGRNTVSVLRGEIGGYQEKIRVLETRQTQLVKENSELRDLCVYLDQQRTGAVDGQRNGLDYVVCHECSKLKKEQDTIQRPSSKQGLAGKSFATEQVHDLQNQIAQLEKEKDSLHKLLMYGGKSRRDKKRVSFSVPTDEEYDSSSTTSELSDRLEFPPSFGGSQDNFGIIMEATSVPSILRNGSYTSSMNGLKPKLSDISPRNNDLNRLQQRASLNEDELNKIRAKLSRSTMGEGTLSEREINLIKDMCHIETQKDRSIASTSSFNNSFDQSPLSPPPPINSVPLYGGERSNSKTDNKQGFTDNGETNFEENATKGDPPLPSYNEIVGQKAGEQASNE